MTTSVVASSFWLNLLGDKNPDWVFLSERIKHDAEVRRAWADYDTGSIATEEVYALLALAERIRAQVVIEVGTFVGASTMAMAAARTVKAVYTCDSSNDCLPSAFVVHCYPKQTSTQMLRDLIDKRVVADLCFFDGVLSPIDVDLLAQVTHERTYYAFHDYNFGPKIRKSGKLETVPRKGVGNVRLLYPRLPKHVLIEPFEGSTLALLVPKEAA